MKRSRSAEPHQIVLPECLLHWIHRNIVSRVLSHYQDLLAWHATCHRFYVDWCNTDYFVALIDRATLIVRSDYERSRHANDTLLLSQLVIAKRARQCCDLVISWRPVASCITDLRHTAVGFWAPNPRVTCGELINPGIVYTEKVLSGDEVTVLVMLTQWLYFRYGWDLSFDNGLKVGGKEKEKRVRHDAILCLHASSESQQVTFRTG